MTRFFAHAAVLITVLCSHFVAAADPAAQVDAKLATKGDIWQGQRVIVTLTLKTPDTFASAPTFDLPQVPGMIIVPPTESPVLGTETIDDTSYTTQIHELNLFPQQAGSVTIPPFTIRFDSSAGFGKPTHARTVTTTAISFTVKQPPGTDQLAAVLTTTKFRLKESWQPDPSTKTLSVGDTLTRTIQIQADDLPGIILPTFKMPVPDGLRLYDHAPVLDDQINRGDLEGKRTETSTIVCEVAGTYELPAMTVTWWNSHEQKLNQATLPAHAITVKASTDAPTGDDSGVEQTKTSYGKQRLLMLIVAIATVLAAEYFLKPRLMDCWRSMLARYNQSEQKYFYSVVAACRSDNAKDVYHAILAWQDQLQSDSPARTNPSALCFESDPQLFEQFALLESHLYGQSTNDKLPVWSSDRLLTSLRRFRTHWKRTQFDCERDHVLPDLNPANSLQ